MRTEEFIMVAVPQSRVLDVYALLTRSDVGPSIDAKPVCNEARVDHLYENGIRKGWSIAEINRAVRESSPAMQMIMRQLATHAGNWVIMDDLVTVVYGGNNIDEGRKKISGVLGAFGHRVHRRYSKDSWFFATELREGRYWYRMTIETAELMVAALSNGPNI